jgi:UDP-N-acetylglucosamine--N-acetylmuramyl-(pentapeptide) pyrophosphoryl-undecaprenol N-acetylglucosamine transferase
MRRQKPDVVLAMGGFGSVGPCLAARLMRIPTVLHESNAIPGRAIRFLSKEAAAVAVGLECARAQIRCRTVVWTGIPVRQEILRVASQKEAPGFCLLVIGGSGGAHAINDIVSTAVCKLPQSDLRVIHLTGTNDEELVNRRYADAGVSADVRAFEQNIAALYAEADFVICRAGASTCAEIAAMNLPALMIPLPWAADNHQLANAKAFSDYGMMDFVRESECTIEWLADYLRAKIDRLGLFKREHLKIKAAAGNAAKHLAELVEKSAR